MKEIKLTQGKFALVDDEDFDWLNQWKWYANKGHSGKWYATRSVRKKGELRINVKMHRQILGLTDPKIQGEHADGDGLNNQRINLRPATNSQNQMNKGSKKNSYSKYVGVTLHTVEYKDKTYKYWRGKVYKEKLVVFHKYFKTEIEAALAYNEAAKIHHKEFARLNVIPEETNLFTPQTTAV